MGDQWVMDGQGYRKFAAECLELARIVDAQHQQVLLTMAQTWLKLAGDVEGTPPHTRVGSTTADTTKH
jgi:hypothetical protein